MAIKDLCKFGTSCTENVLYRKHGTAEVKKKVQRLHKNREAAKGLYTQRFIS